MRKKIKWLLFAFCLALLVGSGWIYFLVTQEGGGTSFRVLLGSASASARSGSISAEIAPELTEDGLTAKVVGSSADVTQIAFIRKERYGVKVRVTAGKQGVEKLSYTIFGANGEKLSHGKVDLEPLKPGESRVGEIIDKEVPNARRILIHP